MEYQITHIKVTRGGRRTVGSGDSGGAVSNKYRNEENLIEEKTGMINAEKDDRLYRDSILAVTMETVYCLHGNYIIW